MKYETVCCLEWLPEKWVIGAEAHEPELRLFAGLCDGRVSVVTVDGAWRLQHTATRNCSHVASVRSIPYF